MFDVEITATGKHFLRGRVLEESLVHIPVKTTPLMPGQVSGVKPDSVLPHPSSSSQPSRESPSKTWKSGDVWVVLVVIVAVLAVGLRLLLSPLSLWTLSSF